MGPLAGLKVLDLSRLLPGPYATLVLADLGAQVDKLEAPGTGDYARHLPPMKGDTSALFLALNRNKRSIALDLKTPVGVAALKRLVCHYDVLMESFRPGVMDGLGVGYEALAQVNPRLVYCAISGFGATGPERLKAGHDLGYVARAGVLGLGGDAGGPPGMTGAQVADIGGSLFGLVGLLAALHERTRTGKGQFVDVSMTDSALAFVHMHLGARLALGSEAAPLRRGEGELNGGLACYNRYQTRDGRWLAVGALEPKFFQGVCEAVGLPALVASGYDRAEEGAKARAALAARFAEKTLAEWLEVFRARDVCVEPVWEGDEVFDDPQLKSRGMFAAGPHGAYLRTPLRFAEGGVSYVPPPALGGDTAAVLREAGFTSEEISSLLL